MSKSLIVFIVIGVLGIVGIRLAMNFAPHASAGGTVVVRPVK
jgi:hypothetical protein